MAFRELQLVKLADGEFGVVSENYSCNKKAYIYTTKAGHYAHAYADLSDALITKKLTDDAFQVCGRAGSVRHIGAPMSGTDPEIFAFDAKGAVIPAWLFMGAKRKYIRQQAFWDGVQAELTTEACGCHAYLCDFVRQGLYDIYHSARRHTPGATLECADVVKVPTEILATADDKYIELGCAPSSNVYTKYKPKAVNPRTLRFRFSGCHMHFSTGILVSQVPWWPGGTVRMMDRVLGPLYTALGRGLENPIRRMYYGRPGEYRVGNSKLEYRTPGAFWLSSPQIFNLGMDTGRVAFKMGLVSDGRYCPIQDSTAIVKACDADAAVEILKKHSKLYTDLFTRLYGGATAGKNTFEIAVAGLQPSGFTKKSVAEAWKLNGHWEGHNNRDRDEWAKAVAH